MRDRDIIGERMEAHGEADRILRELRALSTKMGRNADIWSGYLALLDGKIHYSHFMAKIVHPPPASVYWFTSTDNQQVIKILKGDTNLEYEGIVDQVKFYLISHLALDDKPSIDLAQHLIAKDTLSLAPLAVGVNAISAMIDERALYKALRISGDDDTARFHQEPPYAEDKWVDLPAQQALARFVEIK